METPAQPDCIQSEDSFLGLEHSSEPKRKSCDKEMVIIIHFRGREFEFPNPEVGLDIGRQNVIAMCAEDAELASECNRISSEFVTVRWIGPQSIEFELLSNRLAGTLTKRSGDAKPRCLIPGTVAWPSSRWRLATCSRWIRIAKTLISPLWCARKSTTLQDKQAADVHYFGCVVPGHVLHLFFTWRVSEHFFSVRAEQEPRIHEHSDRHNRGMGFTSTLLLF